MAEGNSSTQVEYRPIPDFPGYKVGSDGSVWTIKAKGGNDRTPGRRLTDWRRLTFVTDRRGYFRVALCVDGKTITRLVHRLVLEAFVGSRPQGMEACHYPDLDKTNNTVGNLRWDTRAENERDEYRDRGPVTVKRCRRCGELKAASDFYGDSRASDGLQTECKECHTKISIATMDNDKKRASNREYMRRRRARCKS